MIPSEVLISRSEIDRPSIRSDKSLNSTRYFCSAPQVMTTKSSDEQQHSTESKTSATAANETETQQFKEWLDNYLKQCIYIAHDFFIISTILFSWNFRCEDVNTTIVNEETLSKQCGELLLYP